MIVRCKCDMMCCIFYRIVWICACVRVLCVCVRACLVVMLNVEEHYVSYVCARQYMRTLPPAGKRPRTYYSLTKLFLPWSYGILLSRSPTFFAAFQLKRSAICKSAPFSSTSSSSCRWGRKSTQVRYCGARCRSRFSTRLAATLSLTQLTSFLSSP